MGEILPAAAYARLNPYFTTLVADDGFFFSGLLQEFLEAEEHVILKAATPGEALAKTRQFQPDLILLDSAMGGPEAMKLLQELLTIQTSAAVILLARNPSVADAVEAMKRGAMDYFARPLSLSALKGAIDLQKSLFKMGLP